MYKPFDVQYQENAIEILEKGKEVKGRNNLVYKQVFGQDFSVDLREEFPSLSLRKLPIKNVFREFMWDVTGNNQISKLGKAKHFWEFLAIDGYLPGSYGSSWRSWPVNVSYDPNDVINCAFKAQPFDQLSYIRTELKNNPTNRQLVLQTFNPAYSRVVVVPPCHPCVIFSSDGIFLDSLVLARSNDFAFGVPLDMIRYALLTHILGVESNLIPRFVKFSSANNHIYACNYSDLEYMCTLPPQAEPPSIWVNPNKTLFYLDPECDIKLSFYNPHPALKMVVAK